MVRGLQRIVKVAWLSSSFYSSYNTFMNIIYTKFVLNNQFHNVILCTNLWIIEISNKWRFKVFLKCLNF